MNNSSAVKNIFGEEDVSLCGEIIEDVIMENRQWLKRGIVSGNKNAQNALSKRYE